MSEVIDAPANTEKPEIAAIVERYVQLRDKKAALAAEHKKKVADIDAAMARVESYLLGVMNSMGIESLKTPYGTPYVSTSTSATVADWTLFFPWMQQGDHWDMLEKRVSKTVVSAYKDEHNDLPPGLNWSETRVLNIRRS